MEDALQQRLLQLQTALDALMAVVADTEAVLAKKRRELAQLVAQAGSPARARER